MALVAWICGLCKQYNSRTAATIDFDSCQYCGQSRNQLTASIHPSERVVVNYNPKTGESRIPGRADRPIHPKYAAAGFERRELTFSEIRKLEKTRGLVHEASNYDHSGREERDTHSKT